MNAFTTSVAMWLADYYLLSGVLLAIPLVVLAALKQPAQRLAIIKSTLVALFLLSALCAAPGWSLVHLLSGQEITADQPRPNGSPVIAIQAAVANELAPPIDADAVADSPLAALLAESTRSSWTASLPTIAWPAAGMLVYTLGAASVLAWLCLGAVAARRLVQSAQPAPAELTALMSEVATNDRGRARLLISKEIDVAVALGLWQPAILLPQPWTESQPLEQLRTILAHEWAHLRNHDLRWLAASRTLMILLWPQPLFWLLRRRMRLDQEALADAAAAEITSRQTYAEQLVAWARNLPPRPAPRLSTAVGLWEGPSQLRQRIALLVDEHFTVFRTCSRRYRAAAAILATASALLLSIVTVEPPGRAVAQDAAPLGTEGPTPSATSPPVKNPPAEAAGREIPRPIPNTILGRAVDENGQPLSRTDVLLFRVNRHDSARTLIAEKTSDSSGAFRFDNVIDIAKEFPDGKFPPLDDLGDELLQLVVRAPGRVSDARLMVRQQAAQRGDFALIKMPPAATLRGRVTDRDGKSVANALVSVGSPSFDLWEGVKSARTDVEGNYAISDVAPFDMETYRKQQEEQRRQLDDRRRSGATATYTYFHAPPMLTVEHSNFAVKKVDYEKIPGTKDIQLEPAAMIEGHVAYSDSSRPAANVLVNATTSRPKTDQPQLFSFYDHHAAKVRTDADGRYRFTTLPAGNYDLWAETSDWVNVGIGPVAAVAEQTTQVFDLVFTKGGIVHVRLVDAKIREPIQLPADTKASITAAPKTFIGSRPMFYQSIEPRADGTFELRVLPGENQIFIVGVNVDNEYKWAGATMIGQPPVEVTIADGQSVAVDVPVVDAKVAQANSGVYNVLPPLSPKPATDDRPKTDDITGQVLNPDGTPAAGVRVLAYSMVEAGKFSRPSGYQRTDTDENGRFQLSIYSSGKEVFWILPRDFAQQTHIINDRRGDLGVFKLENGLHLHGRVLDREGKPIPDIWVNAELKGGPAFRNIELPVADNIERSSLTDAEGRFDLGPLPLGTYEVCPDDHPEDNFDRLKSSRPLPAAFLPQRVELSAASELDEIEIRPVESVTIQVRFVDSKGNPTHGNGFFLIGTTPDGKRLGLRRDQSAQEPVTFVAPKGLEKTIIDFPRSAMRVRRAPGEPWSNDFSIELGTLDRDWREIEAVRYRAPTLIVSASDAAGKPIPGFKPSIFYHYRDKEDERKDRWIDDVRGDVDFEPKAGQWLSEHLLPGEEFTLIVSAEGYEPFEQTLSLPEGQLHLANVKLTKTADAGVGDTENDAADEPIDIPIIVAKHVLLHDGKIIEWADVERMVAALSNPKLARPGFYFTHGALPARQEEIRAKIFDFRQRQEMAGHSWGSISPRTSFRYDAIRTAADMVPNAAWRVNGTVETADGLPIDGAEVVLCLPVEESLPYKTLDIYLRNERLRQPLEEVVTTSDNAGRFAVYPPPDTPYYVVALHKEGFGLARSDDFAKNSRVTIQPWARIRGRVKEDARFEQSASVNVNVPAADGWPDLQFHHYSEDLGPASPDGRFEFAFIPPSLAGSLSRSVKGEEGTSYGLPTKEFQLAPGETLTVDVEPPSDAEVKRIDQLKSDTERRREEGEARRAADASRNVAPNELAGRVVDNDGNPVSGVTVDVWTWHSGNETITDRDGRFRLQGFDDGEVVEVEFTKPGYGPTHFAAQEVGHPGWIVSLQNDTYLEGRVLDADGQPAPFARIRAAHGPFRNPQVVIGEVWTETGADGEGRYRLYLAPDQYDVQVRVPNVGLARLQDINVASGDKRQLDIRVHIGPTFRARVVDAQTGEPVPGIRLWSWQHAGIEGTSDADGLLEIENMTPGPFEFQVTAGGEERGSDVAGQYARWWSPDATDKHQQKTELDNGGFQRNFDDLSFNVLGNTEPIKIFVEKAVSIRGRVIDPDGNPVAGATVAPAKTGTGNSITGDTRYSVPTADDGTFHVRLPASGSSKYNLVAHDGKYQVWRRWANGVGDVLQTQPGDELNDVTLQLTRPGVVRGKVVDADGKPVANHRVRTEPVDMLENRYYDPETKTNADGEFELRFVRPGEHFVQADPFWLAATDAPNESTKRVTASPDRPVEGIILRAFREPTEPRFIPTPAGVRSGRVVDEFGKPIADTDQTLVPGP